MSLEQINSGRLLLGPGEAAKYHVGKALASPGNGIAPLALAA